MPPGMAPSPTGPGTRFTPVDPIRLLKQYKLLLALSGVVGLMLGIGVYFALAKWAPKFRAVASLYVQEPMTNPYAPLEVGNQRQDALEMYKLTQARFVYSESNLRSAVNQLVSDNSPWIEQFIGPGGEADREAAFKELEEAVRVNSIPDTQVIEVAGIAGTGREAADLANAVVNTYLARLERETRDRRSQAETLYTRRKGRLEDDIAVLQRQLTDIMDQTQLSATQQTFNEVDQVYRDLITQQQVIRTADDKDVFAD